MKNLPFYLTIVSIVSFILYFLFRKKKQCKDFTDVLAKVDQAQKEFHELTSFSRYFCNYDKNNFQSRYKELFQSVANAKDYRHLTEAESKQIDQFKYDYNNIETTLKLYNPKFLTHEKALFKSLFDNLEENPLSDDQRTSIVTDEDNNLVIAGAGTGKTTTIAGKVAYLINKELASANEILVISFTKSAVNEMGLRIAKYLNDNELAERIKIKTFNSYGFEVVRAINLQQNLAIAFENEVEMYSFLQQRFDELFLSDEDFSKKAINFMAFFSRPERDEFEFETRDKYIKHEKSFKNIGLDGKKYKSKEEVEIANYLFLNTIKYQYECFYPLNDEDKNPAYGSYQPDFYLTDYKIYIEHFGIDENGNVPRFFVSNATMSAKERYNKGIIWKESIHEKYQTKLIKTYSFENKNGNLISSLSNKLKTAGVEFVKKKPEEILEVIKEQDVYADFNKLIATFLGLMKSNKIEPNDIVHKKKDKRLKVFIDVFKPVYTKYQEYLNANSLLDFNDMINVASDGINNNKFIHSYKYVLIDEFQDMSLNRYQLLKSLKRQNPALKIYAVGDDWQSIFRFAGSDISLLTQFKEYFGYSAFTKILNTYRFNNEILNVTSGFIQKNDAQLKKNLTALTEAKSLAFEFIGLVKNGLDNIERTKQTTAKVRQILSSLNSLPPQELSNKVKVFLIGRYHFNNPRITNEYANLQIEFHTAHGVKGLTCDYTILLDVNSGVMGFPSEIVDDPILDYLLHEGDHYDNSEERRLFYVAMTRARHKNYIMYDTVNESKFVKELKEDYNIFTESTNVSICPLCQAIMVERKSPKGVFMGCSNYPICNATTILV